MENLQESLHHARGYFLSGQLDQCQAVLAAMPLFAVEESSILQWVKEHNLILCNKSELKSGGPVTSDVTGNKPRSVHDLKLVQQKLKGIPASRRLCALELAVTYNEAMLALVDGACDTMEVKTKIGELEQNIITCLQRYISIFEDKMDTEKNMSVVEHLNVIRQLDVEPDIVLSMTLVGCSLSIHYLIDGRPRKALQLLDTLTNLGEILTNQEKTHGFSLLLKLPRQNLEVQLLKGGKDCFNPSIVVNLLCAYCYMYICDDNYADCLDILQPIDSLPTHILPVWVYMKSYCLYQEDSVMEAARCLTDLVTTCSDNQLKARCHNLMACCLAKQNRLNSAIQQFREALQQDFCYLEPLFNLSLVYRQQNLYDAELESLNLLVTALENTEASSEGDHRQTTEVILGKSAGLNLISVLYALAKRCLELKRYSIAAEKYLDLLSVLDEASVLSQASSMSSNLPTAGDMYLEAAFALFKSGQYEESLLICDQVISKATLPENFTGCHDQDDPQSTELLLSGNKSCPMSKQSQLKLPNSSTDIVANFVDSSRTATGSRKRHRDDANSCDGQMSSDISQRSLGIISQRSSGIGQMSSDIKDKLMVDTKHDSPKSKQLHLYCAALLLKSQCYRTVGKFSDIEALVDRVLAILEEVNRMESVAAPLDDCGGSDTVGLLPNECEPKLKKRKLSEGKISTHCEYTSTSYQPIKDSLLELKAQACSDKALILIGQGNLQEAMKFLLRSLQCQPGNPTALFNYATLLLKMGRKQDSMAAFSKYRKIETNVERLTALESLMR